MEGGRERTAQHPWEATRQLALAAEEFEIYPNRDSMPFVPQYGIPGGWHLDTFIRGTLRNAGWRAAWAEVSSTVRARDDARIRRSPKSWRTGIRRGRPTGTGWCSPSLWSRAGRTAAPSDRGEQLLDVTREERESAMAKCVSLPLAFGLTRVLEGALSPSAPRG